MKKKKIDVGHRAVPRPYEPGYPAKLDRAEYQALIAGNTASRVRRLIAGVGVAAAGGIAAAQGAGSKPAEAAREEQVLRVLREGAIDNAGQEIWFGLTSFQAKDPPGGGKYRIFLPRVPISFGNSYSGVFDAGEARRLARRLFQAYGYELRAEMPLTPGAGRVVLDGCDRDRRIGFKIRGAAQPEGRFVWPAKESADADLSDDELSALTGDGFRVHVAELKDYPVMDGDTAPSMFAYLASIVDFLNGVTDGPDIDLATAVLGWQERIAISDGDFVLPKGIAATHMQNGWYFKLAEPGKIVIDVRPRPGADSLAIRERGRDAKWRVTEKPLSTEGSPTLVGVPVVGWGNAPPQPGPFKVRLIQERGAPLKPLEIEARGAWILAPSSFDAARPFRLEVEGGAFDYRIDLQVLVTVMPK